MLGAVQELQRFTLETGLDDGANDNDGTGEDDLSWWSRHQFAYQIPARLEKKYLAIPALPAASEWVFLSAGNVVMQERTRLGDDLSAQKAPKDGCVKTLTIPSNKQRRCQCRRATIVRRALSYVNYYHTGAFIPTHKTGGCREEIFRTKERELHPYRGGRLGNTHRIQSCGKRGKRITLHVSTAVKSDVTIAST